MEVQNVISARKIENDNVHAAIEQVLEDLDAKKLMRQNMTILLKPNILGPFPIEKAATTHPEVIRSVIQWVKKFNPKKIYVCDSSGGKDPNHTDFSMKKSGIFKICEEENVYAIPFERTAREIYKVPNPLVLNEIASSILLKEADLIINLPKIKTHELTYLTCCIKNMFGTVLLVNKAQIHAKFVKMDDFNAALADVYSVSQPKLTIVDGYYCQEGKGPSAGDIIKHNLILGGYDGIALDTYICQMIGLDPKRVLYLDKCIKKGIGKSTLDDFQFLGEKFDKIFRRFKIKKQFWINLPIPKQFLRYISNILFHSQIKIKPEFCQLCSICWKNCPVDALKPPLTLKVGQYVPKWNRNSCITCYCCAELCPHQAIKFRVNYFRNLVRSPLGVLGGVISLCILAIILIIVL